MLPGPILVSPEPSPVNFPKIDLDGDGRIELNEFFMLIEHFFRSDDPQHPANLLIGQL